MNAKDRIAIVAPDKFRGSAHQKELIETIATTLDDSGDFTKILKFEIADGGEGTSTIWRNLGWHEIKLIVAGPLGDLHQASIYQSPDQRKIGIELAECCGTKWLSGRQEPLDSSTFGLGQALKSAMALSPSEIIVALGGSASSDAGAGIAEALGLPYLDAQKKMVRRGLKGLGKFRRIDHEELERFRDSMQHIKVRILTDVANPICGKNGAIRSFGEQKGLNSIQRRYWDRVMYKAVKRLEKTTQTKLLGVLGFGAAGGTALAINLFFQGDIESGAEYCLQESGFLAALPQADLVVTGEGKLDSTTIQGKTVFKILTHCRNQSIDSLVVVGQGKKKIVKMIESEFPLTRIYSLTKLAASSSESLKNPHKYIKEAVTQYLKEKD